MVVWYVRVGRRQYSFTIINLGIILESGSIIVALLLLDTLRYREILVVRLVKFEPGYMLPRDCGGRQWNRRLDFLTNFCGTIC